MSRYQHYLRPASRDIWPPRVIVVSCRADLQPDIDNGRVRYARLSGWNATSLLRKDGAYVHHAAVSGQTAAAWWDWIDTVLVGSGTTLVISPHCARTWALLGLWEELEDGRAKLGKYGTDLRTARSDTVRRLRARSGNPLGNISTGSVQRLLDASSGLLVCDDPPTILRSWRRALPGLLEWIDTRNFGAECPDGEAPGACACAWATRWFLSLASALQSYQLGSIRATAGSQALHGWRRGYYHSGMLVHNHAQALALEGAAYYGGRCECYRIGKIPCVCVQLDVRSMYPWVMHDKELPMRLHAWHGEPVGALRACEHNPLECCARVEIETDSADYPYRREKDVIYPVGRFDTVLAGPELQHALERGRVCSIASAAQYTLGRPLRDYAAALYRLRCEAESSDNVALASTAKALLVCLPGKLAQRQRQWVAAPNVWSDLRYGVWYGVDAVGNPCRYRAIAGHMQREDTAGWGPESMPATAAWITSYARLRLLAEMERIGREHVYYVDTDSLITSEDAYVRTRCNGDPGNGMLGALQTRTASSETEIRGIKYYIAGGTVICAGMPRAAIRDGGDRVAYWRDRGPWEGIYANGRPGAESVQCDFYRYPAYAHGVVGPGGIVTPIRLGEA